MLGIDIVDLTDPALQKRTDRTLELIKNRKDVLFEHPQIFWILWSAKEAIFKYQREPINFSPKKIITEIYRGNDSIDFRSGEITGKVIVEKDKVLALAGDPQKVDFKIFDRQSRNWSDSIRKLIISFFNKNGKDYEISSDDLNLPIILPSKTKISISHHGKWGAFAYPKELI